MLNRRRFISISLSSAAYSMLPGMLWSTVCQKDEYIMTVSGKIKPDDAGIFLPHEHTFTDFTGAEKVVQPQYNQDSAFNFLMPYLKELKANGVKTIAECTPAYIGRDVVLLKRLSDASGINILTNTGYYAAVDFKYIPDHAHRESSEQLASRWLKEWQQGIAGSGIKPGFIKLGVGAAPLKPLEKKLIIAAAITHLKSGLKIAIHTGDGAAALEEQELLEKWGVSPSAMIWVHAQNDDTGKYHLELAHKGCWISLDGFNGNQETVERYCKYINSLKDAGLLKRVLISHDDGFSVIKDSGFEAFKKGAQYTTILTKLQPALLKSGLTEGDIKQLTVFNPSQAFKVEINAAKK
jgi:predicted metal-dependent phosphotriesterase family hydrolase